MVKDKACDIKITIFRIKVTVKVIYLRVYWLSTHAIYDVAMSYDSNFMDEVKGF